MKSTSVSLPSLRRTFRLREAVLGFATLTIGCSLATAQLLFISGVGIVDNGPFDLDPAVGVIEFSNMLRPIPGVQFQGLIEGKVTGAPGDTSVSLRVPPPPEVVTLTSVSIFPDPATKVAQHLSLAFSHTYLWPVDNAIAADGIRGLWIGDQTRGLTPMDMLNYQGYINGDPIGPSFINFSNPLLGPVVQKFVQKPHVKIVWDGHPPWTLEGRLELDFTANSTNAIWLANSAEVALGGGAIPEPSAYGLLGATVLGLLAVGRRLRAPRCPGVELARPPNRRVRLGAKRDEAPRSNLVGTINIRNGAGVSPSRGGRGARVPNKRR